MSRPKGFSLSFRVLILTFVFLLGGQGFSWSQNSYNDRLIQKSVLNLDGIANAADITASSANSPPRFLNALNNSWIGTATGYVRGGFNAYGVGTRIYQGYQSGGVMKGLLFGGMKFAGETLAHGAGIAVGTAVSPFVTPLGGALAYAGTSALVSTGVDRFLDSLAGESDPGTPIAPERAPPSTFPTPAPSSFPDPDPKPAPPITSPLDAILAELDRHPPPDLSSPPVNQPAPGDSTASAPAGEQPTTPPVVTDSPPPGADFPAPPTPETTTSTTPSGTPAVPPSTDASQDQPGSPNTPQRNPAAPTKEARLIRPSLLSRSPEISGDQADWVAQLSQGTRLLAGEEVMNRPIYWVFIKVIDGPDAGKSGWLAKSSLEYAVATPGGNNNAGATPPPAPKIDDLIKVLESSDDVSKKAKAAEDLAAIGVTIITPLFKSLGKPGAIAWQDWAGVALAGVGPAGTPALVAGLDNRSAPVRYAAVYALGQAGPGQLATAKTKLELLAKSDPSPDVKNLAAAVLQAAGF